MRLALLALALPALFQGQENLEGTAPCRPLRPSQDTGLQPLLRKFEFADREFAWKLQPLSQGAKVDVSWVTFPSAVQGDLAENNTVWAKFWQPKDGAKKRPAVVLLHWLGGSFQTLEIIGTRLAENGIACLMMYLPHYGPRKSKDRSRRESLFGLDMNKAVLNVRQAVLDARRAGDWLASRPDVEPSRIGLVGISLGAVIGSLTAGVDDRFSRSVFLIGGGDLPAIILHGSKETVDQKKKIEEAGLTPAQLQELWHEIEPITYASRVRPEDVLMMNAEEDEIIPRACTERLHEAMGRPELRWFKGGHYSILFQIGPILKTLTEHLSRRTEF